MAIHYCEKCKKPLVRAKPHYIPLGTDEVLKIIDETCEDCGGAYINKNQQTTVIKNKEAHDRLIEIMKRSSKGCVCEKIIDGDADRESYESCPRYDD